MSESHEHHWWDAETPEQSSAAHLQENPALERRLWREWVGVVCGWQTIPGPDPKEWTVLEASWYHNKAPIDSVAELKGLRQLQPAVEATVSPTSGRPESVG